MVAGCRTVIGSSTRCPLVQSRSRVCFAAARSRSCPSTGGTGTGVTPSKRTVPSAGCLLTTGASCCSAESRASSSDVGGDADLARGEERPQPGDRVERLRAGAVDRARPVDGQACGPRVDLAGDVADRDGDGRVVRGSTAARTRCSASAWLRPPISWPATVTPRGTRPRAADQVDGVEQARAGRRRRRRSAGARGGADAADAPTAGMSSVGGSSPGPASVGGSLSDGCGAEASDAEASDTGRCDATGWGVGDVGDR